MRRPLRRAKTPKIARRVPRAERLPQVRLPRPALLASTALTACFALALGQALAQPAPNARPEGGNVVAGQASIARQPNNTVVTQSSQRAAIDWRSFDVGRDQTVTFQQPAPSAIALNRVTTPNPTQIAGRIQANGQVVVVNGAGIMVHQGAVVEAQSFIASTADTTNAAFMAGGRLTFDRPGQPGARIENRGDITVRDTGLAALVAPGVANSGRIRARLGTVVLAGAETHTIDFHGDGLVAFDVTGAVRTAPLGADGRPVQSLVTNTGTIVAEGGNVVITARAVDGLVQDLVTVGGTVRADSVGDRTGSIQVTGVGGGIRVHGTVAADGARPGERGGTVVVNGPGEVTLGSTARVTASGAAGGGTVAVGTTAARARAQGGGVPADSAWRVNVNAGAVVEANATDRGDGGRIGLLAVDRLDFAGHAAARGGPNGGNGGRVELSSSRGFSLTGTVDTTAPLGLTGTLLIDPRDLTIGSGTAADPLDQVLTANFVETQLSTTNVRLEAERNLTVDQAISTNSTKSLTLAAGNNVVVNKAIDTKGDITLIASDTAIVSSFRTETGSVQVNAAITTKGNILLQSSGTSGSIAFGAGGSVEGTDGASTISLVANAMTLPGTAGSIKAPTVEIAPFSNTVAMAVGAGATAGATTLALADTAWIDTKTTTKIQLGATTPSGTTAAGITLVGNFAPGDADGTPSLDLRTVGAVTRSGGTLTKVGTLSGDAASGFALDGANHSVGGLGTIDAGTGAVSLKLAGDVTVPDAALTGAGGISVTAAGSLGTAGLGTAGALTLTAGTNLTTGTLGGGDVTLTSAAVLLNSGIFATGNVTISGGTVNLSPVESTATGGVISLTGTSVVLGNNVNASGVGGRISIAADTLTRTATKTLATGDNGTIEIARNTLGAQTVTDLSGILTGIVPNQGTLRIGAVTRPGGAVETTATTLSLAGATAGVGAATLDLRANGAVTQGGVLNFGGVSNTTLTGTVGSISLGGGADALTLANLGALTANGAISLTTTGALSVNGSVTAGNTGAGDLTLVTKAGALTLNSTGSLSTGTGGANGGAISLTGAGGISLAGNVTARTGGGGTGTLSLVASGGNVTQTTGVVSAASTLSGSASGSFSLGGTNAALVTKLGPVTAGGALSLTTAGALDVTGTVQAGNAGAGNLTLVTKAGGLLTVSGSLATGTGGANGGAISLTGAGGVSLGGNVTARSGGGGIGTLNVTASSGNLTQTVGTLFSADAGSLTATTGNVSLAGTVASNATLGISAGGTLTQTAGSITSATTLSLNGAGGITQTGGTMQAATLNANALGAGASISLPGANLFNALGTLQAAGSVTLTNAQGLTSVGTVIAGRAPSGAVAPTVPVEVRVTAAGALPTSGTITAGQTGVIGAPDVAGNVTLVASGGATLELGVGGALPTLTAVRLTGIGGGQLGFEAPGGTINVQGKITAPPEGGISLRANLVVIGSVINNATVEAPSGRISIQADGISLATSFNGVSFVSVPRLIATGGTIALAPQSPGGSVSLNGAGGTLAVTSATLSALSTGSGTLEIGRADGGALTVAANTDITGIASTLRLLSASTISATTGVTLTAGRLDASGTDIQLAGAAHAIGTLGNLSATAGSLAFKGNGTTTVIGAVSARDDVTLTAPNLSVSLFGSVQAGSLANQGRTVTLTSDTFGIPTAFGFQGSVSAPGIGGTVVIQPFTPSQAMFLGAGSGLLLTDTTLKAISAETLVFGNSSSTGNITVGGVVDLTGRVDRLRLLTQGSVTTDSLAPVTGIIVNRLGSATPEATASVGGISLTGIANSIGFVDNITTGSFTLTNAGAVTLAGTLTAAGSIDVTGTAPVIGAEGLVVTGTVQAGTLPGTSSASPFGGNLQLAAAGASGALRIANGATAQARSGDPFFVNGGVTLSANGTITTGSGSTVSAGGVAPLSLQAGAGVTLGGALSGGNNVDIASSVGTINLSGGASLATTAPLISLRSPGGIALNGTITAATSRLDLDTNGAAGGGGSVTIGTLTGNAGSLAPTTPWNVPTLGGFQTTGGLLDLDVNGALNVTGAVVSAGGLRLDATGSLGIATTGSLSAPGRTVTLTAGNGINALGAVTAGTLTGTAGTGAASFSAATNAVGTLGNFTGTGFTLFNTGALSIAGAVSGTNIARIESGSISMTPTGSSVTAIGGLARLVATGGDLTLRNTVSGQQVFLSATGALTVPAGATAEATAAAGLGATGGSFDIAGTLRSAGGLSLTTSGTGAGVVRSTGTLDSNGAGALLLVTAGSLDTAGTLDSAGGATLRGTNTTADIGGSVTASGTLVVSAGTGLTLSGTLSGTKADLGAGTLLRQTGGSVDATAGSINATAGTFDIAGTLTANTAAASDVVLAATTVSGSNSFGGTITAKRDLRLEATAAGAAMTVSGGLTGGSVAMTANGALTQTGASSVTANTGNIVATGGTLSLSGGLTANTAAGSDVLLTATGVGGTSTLGGTITAKDGLTVAATGAGASLTLSGALKAGGAATVEALSGTSTIVQTQGSLEAGSVTLTAGGALTQDSGATITAKVGNLSATGGTLSIAGDVLANTASTSNVSLTANSTGTSTLGGTIRAGQDLTATANAPGATLALTGTLSAGGAAQLTATGNTLSQNGGSLTAASVGINAGAFNQTGAATKIEATGTDITATVGSFNVAGTLDATRNVTLTASGPAGGTIGATGVVDAANTAALTAQAGNLTIDGTVVGSSAVTLTTGPLVVPGAPLANVDINLNATGTLRTDGTLTLTSAGIITAPGTLDVANAGGTATLTGQSAGNAIFSGANQLDRLGPFKAGDIDTTNGTSAPPPELFQLRTVQATDLTVVGPVVAPAIKIDSDGTGRLVLVAPAAPAIYTLDTADLRLTADSINQISGAIRTTTLTVLARGGDAQLEQPGNFIRGLTGDSDGNLIINTPLKLNLIGDIKAVGFIEITSGGELTITDPSATVNAGTTLSLTGTSVTSSRPLDGTDVTITATAGNIALSGGDLTWSGTLTLSAPAGSITQSGGSRLIGISDVPPGSVPLLTGNARDSVSLANTGNVVPRLGTFTAGSGFSLKTTTALTVEGKIAAGTGLLSLASDGTMTIQPLALSGVGGTLVAGGGLTQQAGGSLSLGSGALFARADGGDLVLDGVNTATGADLAASGSVTQQAGGSLTLGTGTLLARANGGNLVLNGANAAVGADLAASGAVTQQAGGSLALGSGALTVSAGGNVTLDGANGAGSATVTSSGGAISQQAGGSLALGGALAMDAAGDLTLDGAVSAASANLRAGGAIGQIGGATLQLGGPLVANAGGALTLGGTTTATSATLRSGGSALLAGTAPAGAAPGAPGVLGGSLTLSGALDVNAGGDVALDGAISTTALTITSGGTIGQPGSATLSMPGSLTLNAAGGVILDGAVSAASATVGAGGAFGQATGGSLALGGPLGISANAGITLNGVNTATAATLNTGGTLLQASTGRLTLSGPLSVSAGAATIDGINTATSGTFGIGGSLAQAAGGSLALSGPLALNAGGNVTLNGGVSASTVNVGAGGALSQAAGGSLVSGGAINLTSGSNMTLDGTVLGNPMRLVAGGDISQAASGNLATGTFSVQAGGSATFRGAFSSNSPNSVTGTVGTDFVLDGTSTQLIVLRDVTAGRSIVVDADGTLRLDGTISAPSIIIQAGGQLLMGTLTLNTGGVPYIDLPPGTVPLTRLPDPIPGTAGALLGSGSGLIEAQLLIVQPLGSPNATLALQLPEAGGLIQLGSLRAPTTDVTFDLGTGGRVVANVNIQNLTILGLNGSAELRGQVRGFSGQSAASVAGLGPQPNSAYKINDCPVGSVNCVQLVVQLAQTTDPLRALGNIVAQEDRDDADIFLPNVADRDF